MKKIIITALALTFATVGFSQEENDSIQKNKTTFGKIKDNLSGSLESNIQWYNDDKALGDFFEGVKDPNGEEHLRANSYLNLDYNFLNNFTVGVQVESYAPMSLLNYTQEFDDTNIAQYYARYNNNKLRLDVTGGYFYEQFGSGLLLRSYEERQLGTNNALRGVRVVYSPIAAVRVKALWGQQRIGLDEFPKQEVTKAQVFGADVEVDLKSFIKTEKINSLSLGVSYVGKQEDLELVNPGDTVPNGFPEMVNSYAVRLDADFGKIYFNAEYDVRGEDTVVYPANAIGGIGGTVVDGKYFDGNATLLTVGYTKRGLGVTGTFRRLENMAFFSERKYNKPGSNLFNLSSMNYIPSLTKQHDYSLTSIYVYSAQPFLNITNNLGQAGEIGSQFDVFYKFKKGSALGGKYGTKVNANLSYWALLDAKMPTSVITNAEDVKYEAEFLKFGAKLFRDFNFEVRKKLSPKLKMIGSYVNVVIDRGLAHGSPAQSFKGSEQEYITSHIGIAEATYKLSKGRSVRLEGQHMWSNDIEKGNWAGGTLEYALSRKVGLYATDMWNYGNEIDEEQVHYYNFGGSYTTSYSRGALRAALNYGRQRAGLVCVGGVCRQVPQNTGLTVNLALSF